MLARSVVALVFGIFLVACAAILGIDDRGPYEEPTVEAGSDPTDARDEGTAEGGSPDGAAGPISTNAYVLVRQGGSTILPVVLAADAPQGTTIEALDLPSGVTATEVLGDLDSGASDAGADADASPPPSVDAGPPGSRRLLFSATTQAKQGSSKIRLRALTSGALFGETTATLLVAGKPGTLDLSFGTAGIVHRRVRGPGDEGVGIAVQSDGKIVVAVASSKNDAGADNYDFALARFNSDGSIDDAFGDKGVVTTDLGTPWDQARGLVQLDDGRLIVGGQRDQLFAAVRYFSDGGIDSTFGDGGVARHGYGWYSISQGVVVQREGVPQTNGSIVVFGAAAPSTTGVDRYMVRLTQNGQADLPFGNNGIVHAPLHNTKDDQILAALVQPDGKVVTAAFHFYDQTPQTNLIHALLTRWNNNGTYDDTFTPVGVPFPGSEFFYTLARQPDGKILTAGVANGSFYVMRVSSSGVLDPSFDNSKNHPLGTYDSSARAMVIEPNGKIILAGWAVGANHDVALMRLDEKGVLDPSFGADGKVVQAIGVEDEGRAMVLEPDGRILVTGFTGQTGGKEVFVLRYWQ